MNVLITGITGNIGSVLADNLRKSDCNVIGLARKGDSKENIIAADLMTISDDDISTILKQNHIDTLIHCAAEKDVKNVHDYYLNSFAINKFFTNELGKHIRYIIIGSAAEYGITNQKILGEQSDTSLPITNYGISKYLQTKSCYFFRNEKKVDITVLRLFNLLSPFLPFSSLVGSIIHHSRENITHNMKVTNLNTMRDYLDVRDFSILVEKVVRHPKSDFLYNVASGKSITYRKLVEVFNLILSQNSLSSIVVDEEGVSDITNDYTVDISKVSRDFDWKPTKRLEESAQWCLEMNEIIPL